MANWSSGNRWSIAEEDFLTRNYHKLRASGCKEYLKGRSIKSINAKANALGLTDPKIISQILRNKIVRKAMSTSRNKVVEEA